MSQSRSLPPATRVMERCRDCAGERVWIFPLSWLHNHFTVKSAYTEKRDMNLNEAVCSRLHMDTMQLTNSKTRAAFSRASDDINKKPVNIVLGRGNIITKRMKHHKASGVCSFK